MTRASSNNADTTAPGDSAPGAAAHLEAPGADARGLRFVLERRGGRLWLRALHHPGYGAVCADWTSADVLRRVAGGRRQLLARAVGLARTRDPAIVDATAGLGRDGFVLAALGARVILVERSGPVVRLLEDARVRAAGDPRTAEAAGRIEIVQADARDWLTSSRCDVVYLDPMYPSARRTALAAKELQILGEIGGGDAGVDALLPAALAAARSRVVVKRPRSAAPLAGRAPNFALHGTQARFDVYLTSSGP